VIVPRYLLSRREDILETECISRPADEKCAINIWGRTPWNPMCGRPKWQGSLHFPFKGCLALKKYKKIFMENLHNSHV